MAGNLGWLIAAIVLFLTGVLAIIISISARKIDFGDRIIRPRSRPILSRLEKRKDRRTMAGMPAPSPVASSEPYDEDEYDEKPKAKKREKMVSRRERAKDPTDIEAFPDDEYTEKVYADALTGGGPPPEKKDDTWEPEMADEEEVELYEESKPVLAVEAEREIVDEAKPVIVEEQGHSRDLSIQLPKNMCLEEVFRLKITLIRAEEFEEELALRDLELDKKEAEYFSLTVSKLGEKVVEATTRISGLAEGGLIVRPIAIGNVAVIAPAQRTIYFNPEDEEIIVEFYITPTRWTTDVMNVLRIEFEQNYTVLKAVNVPMRIYKRKYEAMFGFNLSKWHKYVMFVYSGIGTIIGLYGTVVKYLGKIQALNF
ncbi:MAG: hypothetical protein H7641_14945 [Candidatus Heimdallarchaeota archaeon]|nr:hypothetical protein [Candidatus Heimdallarchaeota archaeon]MCK4878860.1 hypothetical protein [Candidatus Heimdallarchaeota archaeon]